MQLIATGIPYETPRATTEAEIIALNALSYPLVRSIISELVELYLLEPRKMHPKITTKTTVR
jgi:hypothetical protein